MDNKKNILVNFLNRKGGTNAYAYEMTKGLVENGGNVYAIVSEQNDRLDEWKKLALKGLIIIPTYTNKYDFFINSIKFYFRDRFKVKKIIDKIDIDVVYTPHFHPWFRFINNMKPKAKKIITVHDPIPHSGSFFKNKLIWIAEKKDLKKADELIILSNIFKKYMIETYNKSSDNIHVIPHGAFVYYKNKQANNYIDIYDNDKINFLFFGRIEPYKGLNILAKAYRKISKKYKNVSLTVVGSGDFSPYKNEYKDLVNFRLINRWIDDSEIGSFFCGKNIVTVLPYLNATQSGVINIAMMYKSLIIASNTGGLKEQVQDKITGLLVIPNSEDSLAKAMEFVINNQTECLKYITQASEFLLTLDWKKLSKILLDIVEK